jgi:hypothetical protein
VSNYKIAGPNIGVRGIRSSLPSNYIIGRASQGNGPAELIAIQQLGQMLQQTGQTVSYLSQLRDVQLTSLADKQRLRFSASVGKWVNVADTLANLTDVNTTGVITGQLLQFNGTVWAPWTLTYTLAGASDVAISGLANGDILQYNAAATKWKNVPLAVSSGGLILATPGGTLVTSFYRYGDSGAIAGNPRTATISSVAADIITLTAAVADQFFTQGNMAGLAYVRVWNTTKVPAQSAWVKAQPSTTTLQVRTAADISTWVNTETLQLGDPISVTPGPVVAVDISQMQTLIFGAPFLQSGIFVKGAIIAGTAGDTINITPNGASGSLNPGARGAVVGVLAGDGSTFSPCTVQSPISNSNLVFVNENIATTATVRLLSSVALVQPASGVFGGGGSTTLAADTDVAISAPANGQVLTYNSGSAKWTNQTPAASGAPAPTIVQHASFVTGTGAATFTLGATPTPGNILVAFIGHFTNSPAAGTGWVQLTNANGGVADGIAIFTKLVFTGDSTTQTPTTQTGGLEGVIFEINGSLPALMQFFALNTATGSHTTLTQNIPAHSARDLILGCFWTQGFAAGTPPTLTIATATTDETSGTTGVTTSAGDRKIYGWHYYPAAAGNVAITATIGVSSTAGSAAVLCPGV